MEKKLNKKYNTKMGFQKGHKGYATPISEEKRLKKFIKSVKRETDSPNWKGDKAKYIAKHEWARKQIPKPKVCPDCGKEKRLDIANKDHLYKRVVEDWMYKCRSCHNKYDIRFNSRPKPPIKSVAKRIK